MITTASPTPKKILTWLAVFLSVVLIACMLSGCSEARKIQRAEGRVKGNAASFNRVGMAWANSRVQGDQALPADSLIPGTADTSYGWFDVPVEALRDTDGDFVLFDCPSFVSNVPEKLKTNKPKADKPATGKVRVPGVKINARDTLKTIPAWVKPTLTAQRALWDSCVKKTVRLEDMLQNTKAELARSQKAYRVLVLWMFFAALVLLVGAAIFLYLKLFRR
jgi:outer membrane murein-binding lipoprotein Lpp